MGLPLPLTTPAIIEDLCLEHQMFWRAWNEGRTKAGRVVPGRGVMSFAALGPVVAHCFLLERTPEGELYARLVGGDVERFYERPLTGKHISEVVKPEFMPRLNGFYRIIMDKRLAAYTCDLFLMRDGHRVRSASVNVPLLDKDGNCTMAMGCNIVEGIGYDVDAPTTEQTCYDEYVEVLEGSFIDIGWQET